MKQDESNGGTDNIERVLAAQGLQMKYLQVYLRGFNKLQGYIRNTTELNQADMVSICTDIEKQLDKLGEMHE